MNLKGTRRYQLLVHVSAFGAAHRDVFPAGTVGGRMFATISTCVHALQQHESSSLSAQGQAGDASTSKTAACRALREALGAIRRTARALALDTPGVDGKFRLPRSHGDQALLFASRTFVQYARPLATSFIAHGLPPKFVDDLSARIDEFERTIRECRAARAPGIAARINLNATLDAGFRAVRRLDAVVPNLLGDDPAAMAKWRTARHVVRTVRRKSTRRSIGGQGPAEVEHLPPFVPNHDDGPAI